MNDLSAFYTQMTPGCGDELYLDRVPFLLVTCCDFAPEITLPIRLMGKSW